MSKIASPKKKKTRQTIFSFKDLNLREGIRIAGVDEAGRGCMAGPLVCAAVILKPGQKLTGLNDSKKLSAKQREVLYEKITKNCVSFGVGEISEKFIDEFGLTKAVQEGNRIAVSLLKPVPELILIDGCDKQTITLPFRTLIKGDTLIRDIMAASIIAKVTRDRIMCDKYALIYPEYKFEVHKGYCTRLHTELLRKHKPCDIHRKSYTPVKACISEI